MIYVRAPPVAAANKPPLGGHPHLHWQGWQSGEPTDVHGTTHAGQPVGSSSRCWFMCHSIAVVVGCCCVRNRAGQNCATPELGAPELGEYPIWDGAVPQRRWSVILCSVVFLFLFFTALHLSIIQKSRAVSSCRSHLDLGNSLTIPPNSKHLSLDPLC